jgi:nitronate monooxygenase
MSKHSFKSLAASEQYLKKMDQWIQVALEEGCEFFITSLGNPKWVVDKVKAYTKNNAKVFHDVTNAKWAEKAVAAGVDGLICVNSRAGGHLGELTAEELYIQCSRFGLPLVAAGGVGGPIEFKKMLGLGYVAVQMGTRFIATYECTAADSYKQGIVGAEEKDIVSTEKITGVPVSVVNNDLVKKMGTEAGVIGKWLLQNEKTKHWMRLLYMLRSIPGLRQSHARGLSGKDYWQAGKSVGEIESVLSVQEVFELLKT